MKYKILLVTHYWKVISSVVFADSSEVVREDINRNFTIGMVKNRTKDKDYLQLLL